MHLRTCPAMNVSCSHFWRRNQVSALDLAPGKLVPKQSVLDSNLDLSAALFDQHNVFSNILPLRFFEKQKFQPKFFSYICTLSEKNEKEEKFQLSFSEL